MSSSSHHGTRKRERSRSRTIRVRVRPTVGLPFEVSLPSSSRVSSLKETISDRMGLSTHKMTLLLKSDELKSGTLSQNRISDGTEVLLVPSLETGVATTNSMDPVAMMKHSMSGITDKQIDDFLNGKHPLSVAIRMGESVVVVNLHRAKAEDDEPPQKRRCVRACRVAQDSGYCSSIQSSSSSSSSSLSPPSLPSALSCPSPSSSSSSAPSSVPSSSSSSSSSSSRPEFTLNSNPRLPTSADNPPPPPGRELPGVAGSASHLPAQASHRECRDEPCCSYTHSPPLPSTTPTAPTQHISHSDSSVSMKRKAVMEAIGEILKKMYASSEKGRLPGSFKGRFSSEFTCNNNMNDIVHTKTTMAREGEMGKTSDGRLASCQPRNTALSKSNFEENEQLKGKMARVRYRMQQLRAEKAARRREKGGKSPCGWMERLNCKVPANPPQLVPDTGYCGLKKGFLLS